MKNVNANQENVSKKVAVQFEYNPAIRVCVQTDNNDIHSNEVYEKARELVLEKVRNWTKDEILCWVLENIADYGESYEPYDEEYDEN